MQNSTILNYKLLQKIGEGGFAEVWLAEHTKLGTKVAIKVLDRKIIEMDGFKERFLRAAKLLSSLKHPNIVEIIDYDDTEKYAMIMEYLEGPMYREHINQKYVSSQPLQFVPLFLQLLDAVSFIHAKGVIHRDIKPTNVIVLQDANNQYRAKLLDFDIAKDLNYEHTSTLTNQQMGTLTYMSPEQIVSSKNIDIRSDIYSLGVVFFYVLSGKPAYSSQVDSQFQLMEKIVKEPLPDLKTINPNIPNWAIDVLKKATAKDAKDRFQTCNEFKQAIETGLNQKEVIEEEKTSILNTPSPAINETEKTTVFVEKPKIKVEKQEVEVQTNNTKLFLVVGAVVVLGGAGFYFFQNKTDKPAVASEKTATVDSVAVDNSMIEIPHNKKGIENSETNLLFEQGKEAQENKEFNKAIQLYEKAIQEGDVRAMNNLGFIYHYDKKDLKNAIKYYQMAVNKGDVDGMNNLGILYFENNQQEKSKQLFSKAYKIDRNKTEIIIKKIKRVYPAFSLFEVENTNSKSDVLNSNVSVPENDEILTTVEQMPEYPGGIREMYGFIGKNLKYPTRAQKANVSGKVFAKFVVEPDGSLGNVQILKGIGFGCDEEAERVLKSMPKWNPGKQNGRKVRVYFTMPISFVLE